MTLTLDLPAADEAAFRELADAFAQAPADTRAAALQEVIGVLRRGTQRNGASTNGNNGYHTTTTTARPETALPLTAREILAAPPDVRAAAIKASAEAAAKFYASPEGQAEWEDLADWRALDGEPFHDETGDYFTEEEEASFRGAQDTNAQEERKAA